MGLYKTSKFNHLVENSKGDIIVYNYLYKQLCKFDPTQYGRVKEYLQTGLLEEENDLTFIELAKRKLIIPADIDEEIESKVDFMKEITRPVLGLTIYPTMACNFRCPYCYQNHENLKMSDEMKDNIIKYVRKNISKHSGMVVAWFGGEPLEEVSTVIELSKKMLSICHNRNRTYYSSITTNGYNLNVEIFKTLVQECNIRRFAITIDGLAHIHDKQRITKDGKGSFYKIIQNLLDIKTISKHINFEVLIRSNVSVEGYEDLENYVKYMHDKFGDDDRFCFYFRPVYNWGGSTIDGFKNSLLQGYNEQRKIYKKLLDINVPLNLRQHYLDLMESSICYANRINSFAIEVDGKVAKCTGESRSGKNYVGKLDNNGEMNIDNNTNSLWASQYATVDTSCKKCFFEASCHSNFCLVEKLYDNSQKCHCPSGKDFIDEFMLLLDKSNDKYPYIELVGVEENERG